MQHLLTTSPDNARNEADRTLLRSLFGRYRAVPKSLRDDQTAMVLAALCLARFEQLRRTMNDGMSVTSLDTPREDITYYQMACQALSDWNRPSLAAICEFWPLKVDSDI